MTFRERIAIEHPEAISPILPGGVIGCPHSYGYETPLQTACRNRKVVGACNFCWDREAPPRKVKVKVTHEQKIFMDACKLLSEYFEIGRTKRREVQ